LNRIKVPNCRYLNDVIYERDKFEFRYDLDFFVHYFDHRYFHKKKFYDRTDTTRWVAQKVIRLVGNTKYRHTDFNKVVDSIAGMMPYYPVPEYLDSVISELNLEYLATGEIKVKFRNTRQKSIIAKVKPTKIDDNGFGSMGDITFYTGNKRRIIEQLNASAFDSVIGLKDSAEVKEQILADSLETVIAAKSEHDEFVHTQDSLSNLSDSLSLTAEQREVVRKKLDAIFWADDSDSTATEDHIEVKGDLASKPVNFADLDQLVKLAEKEKKAKVAERERARRAAAIKKLQEEEAAAEAELRKEEELEGEDSGEEDAETTSPIAPTGNREEGVDESEDSPFAEPVVATPEPQQTATEVEQQEVATEEVAAEESTKEDSRASKKKKEKRNKKAEEAPVEEKTEEATEPVSETAPQPVPEEVKEEPAEEVSADEPQKEEKAKAKKEKKKKEKKKKSEEVADEAESAEPTPTEDNADTAAPSEEDASTE
jgi:hypothetical protein